MYRFIRINALKAKNRPMVCQLWTTCIKRQEQSLQSESIDDKEMSESLIEKTYRDALKHPDYFGVNKLFTVRQLFESRAHFGHKTGTLNQHMTPYIFGTRLGILILDLDQTAQRLREALNFTAHIAFRGGIILFINRSPNTGHIVERTAKECGQYSHCRQWYSDSFDKPTQYYGAVTRLPDLVILLSTMNNVFETHPAVEDSAKLLIPTIGVVDTNSDPTLITYPIPANDDSHQTIEFFCKLFKQSILLAQDKRKRLLAPEMSSID